MRWPCASRSWASSYWLVRKLEVNTRTVNRWMTGKIAQAVFVQPEGSYAAVKQG